MSFSEGWLSEREAFDNNARNNCIEKNALQYFSTPINIMDIGTGTGNNFIYYRKKFVNDSWTLVDNDSNLLEICRSKSFSDVKTQQHSVHDINSFNNINLITANAVFDLFSLEQFTNFAKKISLSKTSLLTTLNYKSMSFTPQLPEDHTYIKLYEEHMIRQQSFGCAMGAKCTEKIVDVLLNTFCYNIHIGNSNWVINYSHQNMVHYILEFMYHAINETTDKFALKKWIQNKQIMFQKKSVVLNISHSDIFAHP
ncbi:class I SAM-dependent methyltransferase [Candidatus Uabimicrobium sp. HlEnr_7]|uniref:class I SAM-dependent methyltransferase n=1 Tax=Candidatus Uabimicrobium helgolandensis TaxID=3095367 RepID=UPI0035588A1F